MPLGVGHWVNLEEPKQQKQQKKHEGVTCTCDAPDALFDFNHLKIIGHF